MKSRIETYVIHTCTCMFTYPKSLISSSAFIKIIVCVRIHAYEVSNILDGL